MTQRDLFAFRMALRELEGIVPAEDRRREHRYIPSGSLSRARVCLDGQASWLDADVIDLSAHGIRLAVAPGARCRESESCLIELVTNPGRRPLRLGGEIRWVQVHQAITVFGVLLDPDHTPLQPV